MTRRDITHPADEKALIMLKKIPFIDEMCRTSLELAYEKIYRGENLASMVRVSETYRADIFRLLNKVTSIIGIKSPELYIYNDPVMNAFTFGETNTFVCVSSSLVEKMSIEELGAILAHECGHILCQHVLYGSVAYTLKTLGENFQIARLFSGPAGLVLAYWSRRSELSADRCAAVVFGEETFQKAMLKLTLGLADAGNDPYVLLKQYQDYHSHETKSVWSVIQQNCRVAFFSHPQSVNRAYEIDRWKASSTYKRLRSQYMNMLSA